MQKKKSELNFKAKSAPVHDWLLVQEDLGP